MMITRSMARKQRAAQQTSQPNQSTTKIHTKLLNHSEKNLAHAAQVQYPNKVQPATKKICYNDVLHEINHKLPSHRKVGYSDVVKKYDDNYVANYLKNHSGLKNVSNLIMKTPPKCVNHRWTSSCTLFWPKEINFYGCGISASESNFNSQLAAALWLDHYGNLNKNKLSNLIVTIGNTGDQRKVLLSNRSILNIPASRQFSTNLEDSKTKQGERILFDVIKAQPDDCQSKAKPTENDGADSEGLVNTLKIFPNPKNVLHNMFDLLAIEMKNKNLQVRPQYKSEKSSKSSQWICSYVVKWPEILQFSAKSRTKAEASHKAALEALHWMRTNDKISKQGQPTIYDKDQVKTLTKKTVPDLKLDDQTRAKLVAIENVYKSEFVQHVGEQTSADESDEEDGVKVVEPNEVVFSNRNSQQRFLGHTVYTAKEKVELPVRAYKEEFINKLKDNQVVIVKGEPGCGKSTRIPQYVLEGWAREDGLHGAPCRIAVTQPRRIAAISLAERVAKERDESVGNIIGYQVRFKSNYKPATGRILYCTTGILLRHLQSDQNLSNFSHVILDEAHERDVNTDLLMNLLRSAIEINPNLKLIVMSATIDTDVFKSYFNNAPVMEIPGFAYPVKQHYLENCSSLDLSKTHKMCEGESPSVVTDDVVKLISHIHSRKPEGAILCFLPGWEDIIKISRTLPRRQDLVVYCLHSRLQDEDQWKIFSRPPPGVRKVILATNIAETSVTIDDVVYVVDTGIHKEQRFDVEKGVACIDNLWISKASAAQRKGRAGRVQAGESFHLYPKSRYNTFDEYSLPEILRTSLTKIVLDTKVFSNNMNALEFMSNLLSPPEKSATMRAVNELKDLELLDDAENLTSLGKTVADFQLEPKLGKAMVNAVVFQCATPVVDIVTLFSAETELFATGLMDKEGIKKIKQKFCASSDHLAMMRLFEKWLEYEEEQDRYTSEQFCSESNLVPHKMKTIEKLRKLHFDYLYKGLYEVLPIADTFSDNDELVKAVLYSGVGTVLQHRNWDLVKNRYKNNVNVLITRNNQKATVAMESVNFKRHKYPSDYLVYINETRSNIRRTTVVRECSLINPLAVLLLSNKKLQSKNLQVNDYSSGLGSEEQVELYLSGTSIQFKCDKLVAQQIINCKEAINSSYQYFIYQLTKGAQFNSQANATWEKTLNILNDIFSKNRIE